MSSIFGWSYPPGCSGPPEYPDPSPLEDAIYGLMEDAGFDDKAIDSVLEKVIEVQNEKWRKEEKQREEAWIKTQTQKTKRRRKEE